MVANARLIVDPLPSPLPTRLVLRDAVRRLEGAHASVQGLFDTLWAAREQKRKSGYELSRLSHGEVDLLRAAIVFAGAGLDAVLKQIIEDALGKVLDKHDAARGKLTAYATSLVDNEPSTVKHILKSPDANAALKEAYLLRLTKGSLQSEKELKAVRDALGIATTGRFTDDALSGHAEFFTARNQIVHELDLKRPMHQGDPSRHYRRMKTSRDLANGALQLSAAYIVRTNALL